MVMNRREGRGRGRERKAFILVLILTSPYRVSHYLLLGFHKIYLYDNTKPGARKEEFKKVIQPFVEAQYVEVFDEGSFDALRQFSQCLTYVYPFLSLLISNIN